MELASAPCQRAIQDAFNRGPSVVATAGVASIPFLNALKRLAVRLREKQPQQRELFKL